MQIKTYASVVGKRDLRMSSTNHRTSEESRRYRRIILVLWVSCLASDVDDITISLVEGQEVSLVIPVFVHI